MRLKKGFTLAEILIVLMVIGAIATMTIPSLLRGITDAQFKTAYKKAFNTVVNMAAMERVSGNLPTTGSMEGAMEMFSTMTTYLSVKEYAKAPTDALTTAQAPGSVSYANGVTYTTGTSPNTVDHEIGATDASATPIELGTNLGTISPWIITDDNIAYAVVSGTGTNGACSSKADINATTTFANVLTRSCLAIVVDVNGLAKGPNVMSAEVGTDGLAENAAVPDLSGGDRFYIYLGNDGATAGPRKITVTGRIVADQK